MKCLAQSYTVACALRGHMLRMVDLLTSSLIHCSPPSSLHEVCTGIRWVVFPFFLVYVHPAEAAFEFRDTDYWLQGVNFGLNLRY